MGEPVQAVPAQGVASRDMGMIEIFLSISHSEPLHHGSGALIAQGCKGDDLVQSQLLEPDAQGFTRGL